RVLSNPALPALVYGDIELSYGDLDSESDLWAHHLLSYGLEPGSIVGLHMTRSIDMILGILSIMKAGCAYLPINTSQPQSRTKYMLEDCGVNVILSNISSKLESSLNYTIIDTRLIDKMSIDNQGLPCVESLDLAYVIYTSGSTGQPKGVLIKHESLSNLIQYQQALFDIKEDERIVQFSPYYFDASVEQIWLSLSSGATLVILEEEFLLRETSFTSFLRKNKITHFHSTPSFLEEVKFENLSSLRRVVAGGEVCKPSLVKKIASQYPFYNEYGPTETTVTATVYQVNNTSDLAKERIPIGFPIGNTQAYILSNTLELLPQGVIGELYLGGKGLAVGYLNRQDLTDKSFIENPFGEGKIYKTGDQARWLSDGTIEFFGRNDDQVKLRGYRIELGEIEFHLESIDSINRAIVILSGMGETKKLVAYLSGREKVDEAKVKMSLSTKIPDYMIPVVFVWMDSFPTNTNGKIDRKSLPLPDITEIEGYVPPVSVEERELVSIWSEVLGISEEKMSITSNFFKLGGNSLLAIKLKNLIKQSFEIEFPLSKIFLSPKIISIAEKLKQEGNKKQESDIIIPINNIHENDKLFMIHDGSGEIDGYLELSRRIKGYSCYGVKFRLLDDISETPEVTSIAQEFIKEIKKIQKAGPYHLIGWSLGGEIATEITIQLEKEGEKVENLIIIDSFLKFDKPIGVPVINVASELNLLESKFKYTIKNAKNIYSLNKLWLEFSNSEIFKQESVEWLRNSTPIEIREMIPEFLQMNKEELFEAINKVRLLFNASDKYFINHSIEAKTLFIWPNESIDISNEDKLRSNFINFELKQVLGNHFSVMKSKNVVSLSEVINHQLNQNLKIDFDSNKKIFHETN
ncbi:amino acid adenylation domain-containing protein, partial [Tenacibaculum aiptasiae]